MNTRVYPCFLNETKNILTSIQKKAKQTGKMKNIGAFSLAHANVSLGLNRMIISGI